MTQKYIFITINKKANTTHTHQYHDQKTTSILVFNEQHTKKET
jgi:hypothetical protein